MLHAVRNIFDQYRHPENRLSHALAIALSEDHRLRKSFLRTFLKGGYPPPHRVKVVEQRLPGEPETDEEESERRGLPDLCLYDKDTWVLAIESKIEAALSHSQLRRHQHTLQRRGFERVQVMAITATDAIPKRSSNVLSIHWINIYDWASAQQARSPWAARLVDFMQVAESRMVDDEYLREAQLTHFPGIPFDQDNPYTYREAKRLLRLAMAELRKHKPLLRNLKLDGKGKGRPALTGRKEARIWDFIPLRAARPAKLFTEYPHFTLSIGDERLYALMSIPNGIKRPLRRELMGIGLDGFKKVIGRVARKMTKATRACPGAQPIMRVLQRHYPSQRSEAITDAQIDFDLRTMGSDAKRGHKRSRVKYQPQWIEAAYRIFKEKKSNIHLEVGLWMAYSRCPEVRSRKALDLITSAWLSCKPILGAIVR